MKYACCKKSLFFFILIISVTKLTAQQDSLVSGNFENIKFTEFVQQIESSTNYHFFFDTAQTNSITVSISVNKKPLSGILRHLFDKTDFRFSIDKDMHVFVSRKIEILTKLPPRFFEPGQNEDSAVEAGLLANRNTDEGDENKLNTSLENKLYIIGIRTNNIAKGNAAIAGYVRDIKTGEPLIGAAVYVDNPRIGSVTDQFGYYSLTLPKGRHVIMISSVGMRDTKRQVILYSDGKLNVEMQDYVQSLKSVIVSSEKTSNVKGLQMGVERLNMKIIKQIPVVFGEADVLRSVLTLPGVTSAGESSTGFNVRGGASNQNLILFDGATIYNPSHLFGFFSAFNPDVIKDVELYKSSIPEKYGGRLSSVLDITSREGNIKKLSGQGGIGALTGRLTLEGPIVKDKTSFIIGVRTTYSDWLLRSIKNTDYSNSSASFYDMNLGVNHEINTKNKLFLTAYLSHDQFRLNSDTLYKYNNKNINLKWKHIFNNKLNGLITVGYDRYQYSIASTANPVNAYDLVFDINQTNIKADFNFAASSEHSLDFGISNIYYKLHPGSYEPIGKQSLVAPDVLQSEQANETAVYVGDKYEISSNLSLQGGVRFSIYNYLGAHDVYTYAAGLPRDENSLQDTIHYRQNAFIKTYAAPEFRLSARYILSDNASFKISYNTLRQYLHLLTETTTISPTDIWKLSDPYIKPQDGSQYSFGFYKNLKSNTIETSVEVYYKTMQHYLDYKSGAVLVLNHHIETDVVNTKGKSYGIEFMIKKLTGKLNGWISYTFSRTFLKQDDPLGGQPINNGNYYPADFDKPHSVNFIGNYRVSHRFSLSLDIVYSTGRPITLPVAIYYLAGSERVYYSERNQYRVPDYFRTDFSMNIEGNHKVKKFKHSSWSLGVYNVTGRKNPYSIYFIEENGVIKGYKLSIFGTAIPFITYNFKF
ncbi:MAG TPA: TonB-dependent receptor [Puia sp.]|nr:TonB-dependent receptor [Puia sp.]